MTDLVRLLVRNALLGFGISALFTAALVMLDIGGIGGLVLDSPRPALVLLLMFFFLGLTFSSVQMGIAVMQASDDDDQ